MSTEGSTSDSADEVEIVYTWHEKRPFARETMTNSREVGSHVPARFAAKEDGLWVLTRIFTWCEKKISGPIKFLKITILILLIKIFSTYIFTRIFLYLFQNYVFNQ